MMTYPFWDEIRKALPMQPRPKSKRELSAMSDLEAKRFGNELMPYGEFIGMRIDDIALDRLAWYADQKFQTQLRRYLASKRIKAEEEQ